LSCCPVEHMRKAGVVRMSPSRDQQQTMTIGSHVIRRLDSVRILLVDGKEIKFTPTEYHLLLYLLKGKPVSDRELMAALFNSRVEDDFWAREALDRHLDHVRRKFKQHHLKMHVRRISAFGYILLPDLPLRRRRSSSY